MMCSMCPTITFSDQKAPGKGWLCWCGEVHCSHALNCKGCGANRYALESAGYLKGGRPAGTKPTQDTSKQP